MPSPRLHILPWKNPLLPQAVAWLAREWTGDGPLDLSAVLAVVPTRQAGRRLREALAVHAGTRAQAVFPPRVVLPEELVAPGQSSSGIASRAEALLAWVEVLDAIELDDFREVFPVDPPARTFAWTSRLAREFLHLQSTLAENALRIADVPASAGGPFPETARWRELASLESRHDAALAQRHLRTPHAARIEAARAPVLPEGVTRIVLLATPDPQPIALAALGHLADRVAVDVLVVAPEDEPAASLFDAWGRPLTDAWRRRPLALPDFEQHVHLDADPAAQAARIVELAATYAENDGALAVGVADPEIAAPLRNGLGRAGLESYDPDGRKRRGDALHRLLELLGALLREPAFETIAALARCPDVLAWLAAAHGHGFSAARLLEGLDELHANHLPPTLDAAREHTARLAADHRELAPALDAFAALHATLHRERFPKNARATATAIFAARRFDLEHPDDAAAVASASAWIEALDEIARAATMFPRLAAADAWELALRTFGEMSRFDDKPPRALEIQGWLELLWEGAPHLVIAGLNDGLVPSAIVGDAFLPEMLRERLGLKTNAARLARDAYLLQALAAGRRTHGRLDLLFGKTSAAGDPLRPSRLLLLCDDEELPARVRRLFREAPAAQASLPWQRAWRLTPAAPAAITRISVTAFRDMLACPLRFYLKHGLKMEAVDPHKAELDARDFGVLCHSALEAMGADATMRQCTDAAVLREFLLARLDGAARARFGAELSLPLLIQLESARQRLGKAADIQAAETADGWRIVRVESKFEIALGGITVVGKVDRIDRHEPTGRVRVLDYKTSDKPVNPRAAHTRRPVRNEDTDALPDFARFTTSGGEALVWTDLQLPLYRRALAAEFGADIACGYFNLPKASTETAVARWDDYDAALQAAAERCADGILAAIAARRFWPPAELDERNDDFAPLFHHGAEASMAWTPSAPGNPE